MTVTPYLGRDYSTMKDARRSWNLDHDWVITDMSNPYDGKPINKAQADAAGLEIQLRFCNLTKTCNA